MERKDRFTWQEATRFMSEFNAERGYTTKGDAKDIITMVAVISEDSFSFSSYTLTERSYAFTNDNKAFLPNIGCSIFSDCLDGRDLGVRLDWYVPAKWKVEYCYIKEESANG